MSDPNRNVEIDYTNWRGERSKRLIHPVDLIFTSNAWHLNKQWLVKAIDLETGDHRTFAMVNIHSWRSV